MGNHHTKDPTMAGTKIHQVIILQGGTVRYFCKDGLSSLDVMQVNKIMNFGGKIIPVNCGAENEFAALRQAYTSMYYEANNLDSIYHKVSTGLFSDFKIDKTNNLYTALKENEKNLQKFQKTDEFKKWIAGKDVPEVLFQAEMKHECGHRYTGSVSHD